MKNNKSAEIVRVEVLINSKSLPGLLAQSVTHLTADPGVASLILARSHTYVEIDHEIISMATLRLIQVGLMSVTSETSESLCTKYW